MSSPVLQLPMQHAMHKLLPRWPALGRIAVSPALWCLLVTLLLAGAILHSHSPSILESLGDTDDAVRLVSVRDLLAGAPWFDTTLPRIGAPDPLVSHWSRLIDLPLAAMIRGLTPLLGAESAELATRALWPTLLLFGLLLVVTREVQRQAGPRLALWAAAFALFLVVTSVTTFVQFRPGRVDHHNAQILCAVGGLLLLLRSWSEPRVGWIVGALLGLGLAIGYEAIALVAAALGLAAAAALLQPAQPEDQPAAPGAGVANAAAAATATLFLALVLTVPPTRWLDIHCDALSLNLPVLAAGCTAGLWVALRYGSGLIQRLAIAGLGAAVGALAFGVLEPACLAGPFGQVGAEVKTLWLVDVSESKSLFWFAGRHPAIGLASLAFMLAGVATQVVLWRRHRTTSATLALVIMVLAAALGCWQLKLVPYASWLAVVSIAVCAAGLAGTASFSAPVMRIAAVVLLSQATLDAVLQVGISPFRSIQAKAASTGDLGRACYRTTDVQRLATLPSGLVASEITLGPYIAALTTHRVVAAPYHRLEKSIPTIYAIMNSPPAVSLLLLRALGADYVAVCTRVGDNGEAEPAATSLRAQLLDNQPVPQLEEVVLGAGSPVRVWKLAPAN